ncbi:acyl-CoA dehydrogenase [Cupriavidus gilardii]|uniref:acyl-CoA dehydrogenase n=1 Tax=Cupriavidus gilardii TaxID=82541 RepID=UPI001EE5DC1A|nr:acyl-CoA dehydrogenase [Cupriavidus gilardii]MCG5259542.1 acyl-CoA dehydrogenase [Cupriavidus gilardii]MDF9429561.1 acyl-CoA dehydrogenase [Cupriavidus gilardii]
MNEREQEQEQEQGLELEQMLADSAQRLFGNEVTTAQLEAAERGEWQADLWRTVEDSGLTRLFAGEDDGGADAGWQQGLPALLAASRTLAPIPFIDTAVCGWVLAQLGIAMPDGPMALAAHVGGAETERPVARSSAEGWRLDGTVEVPWGRHVRHVVVRAVDRQPFGRAVWLLVPTAACRVETSANLAGEPRDRLRFDDTLSAAAVVVENPADEAMLGSGASSSQPLALGALMRAIQIAGVLERVLNQTVQYATERIQFGRPIAKFQAIQQQLAMLANEVVAARMAVASACAAMRAVGWEGHAMVAKVICGNAAGRAAAIAHQVHGAIGFTHEHTLHWSTRRLWSWRAEYGSEAYWARLIGAQAIRAGGAALWPRVTAPQAA